MAEAMPNRQNSDVEDIFKCSICHSEMNRASLTPCGHIFCTECIQKWLRRNQNCPQCRKPVSTGNLIDGRPFIEIKSKYKERLEQLEREQTNRAQGQSGGMSPEELGNILQSVMPQRDQDMRNLTDSLLSMKDQEINRLKETNRTRATTISELNGQIDSLRGQLGNELPTLTERSNQLEVTVRTQREQNQQLQDKVRTLESSVSSHRAGALQAMEQKKSLEEQLRQKAKEIVAVKAQSDELKKENMKLTLQLQSAEDDLKSHKEQLEKSETTTTQMKELVESMFLQKQMLDADLGSTRQVCLQLEGMVKELEMYRGLHEEVSQQLEFYTNTVVPQKDNSIAELQQKNADLHEDVARLRQNNIPFDQHVQILQSNLEQTMQKLKQYYEKEYGAKIATLERNNEFMSKRLNEKETELNNREEVGDELKRATRTYKQMIRENCELKDQVKTQEDKINQLTRDIAYSKARTSELERKISFLRNSSEE